jgi:hypothetical protein
MDIRFEKAGDAIDGIKVVTTNKIVSVCLPFAKSCNNQRSSPRGTDDVF